MSLRNLFNRSRDPDSKVKEKTLHALIDTGNDTLIALGAYAPALFFLNEWMADTMYVPDVAVSKLREIPLRDFRRYPEWSWNDLERSFKRTHPLIVTEDMRERAVLAAKKNDAIARAVYWINFLRGKLTRGLFLQESVYAEKLRQALALKDADFDERRAGPVPYVAHYAESDGIPLSQAVEEIIFQSELYRDHLVKTEKLRLALFKKIRLAKTPTEIDDIVRTYLNSGVV
jgi:hypothetical protein